VKGNGCSKPKAVNENLSADFEPEKFLSTASTLTARTISTVLYSGYMACGLF